MDRKSRSRSRSRSPSPRGGGRHDYQRDGYGDRADFRGGARNNAGFRGDRRREEDKEKRERERRDRMARMRADNEAEERGDLAASTDGTEKNGDGGPAKGYVPSPEPGTGKKKKGDNDEEIGDDQNEMMRMMGFGGFDSTKGKAVADNQTTAARGAASKNKGRKYRQYMNRKGGFNRPLDKMN
mmetsp:Transcript_37679/g.80482  ORF Transcript_37679/g.80482 Transcript_37679/m.80482 type:complete len:183 (-) Transcript_37679:248-796(-)